MPFQPNAKRHQIILPDFQSSPDKIDREIVQIFMQSFRDSDFSRDEIKILTAIGKTANVTGNSDALVSKILVDNGLQAPRMAFPQEFLDHIDKASVRRVHHGLATISARYRKLMDFWVQTGEDPFAFAKGRQTHMTQRFMPA